VGYSESGFGGALATESNTPVGKAIRAAVIEATDYLACVMYYEDECMDEYYGKERRRRSRTKDAIDLD
jgi:curli biogenesis system outer membrane secretion channel CsgG